MATHLKVGQYYTGKFSPLLATRFNHFALFNHAGRCANAIIVVLLIFITTQQYAIRFQDEIVDNHRLTDTHYASACFSAIQKIKSTLCAIVLEGFCLEYLRAKYSFSATENTSEAQRLIALFILRRCYTRLLFKYFIKGISIIKTCLVSNISNGVFMTDLVQQL